MDAGIIAWIKRRYRTVQYDRELDCVARSGNICDIDKLIDME